MSSRSDNNPPAPSPAPSEPPPAPPAGADPFVDELVEHAAARYVGLIDPAVLAEMKDELRMFLATHPRASPIVDRARGRSRFNRDGSAQTVVPDVPSVPEEAPALPGKAKGQPR